MRESADTIAAPRSRPLHRRATRSARLALRRALEELQFFALYAWFRIMGPPELLAYRPPLNLRLLRAFGARIGGGDILVLPPVVVANFVDDYTNLLIGDDVILNGYNYLDLERAITLEAGVSLGPGVTIMTHNAFNNNAFLEARLARSVARRPVAIRKGAGIKAHSLILHGVTIGEEAVVAGNSLVLRDVPRRAWVSGVPAAVKKSLDDPD
jgi:acetyltransferase-like isoleucine patch superfamily enzyme